MAVQQATLAGGCFWCTEAVFHDVIGVQAVDSGYTGRHVSNPTYKKVCAGDTGHAGAPNPNTDGSYTRYRCCAAADDAGLEAARGSYFMGNYQWARHAIRRATPRECGVVWRPWPSAPAVPASSPCPDREPVTGALRAETLD